MPHPCVTSVNRLLQRVASGCAEPLPYVQAWQQKIVPISSTSMQHTPLLLAEAPSTDRRTGDGTPSSPHPLLLRWLHSPQAVEVQQRTARMLGSLQWAILIGTTLLFVLFAQDVAALVSAPDHVATYIDVVLLGCMCLYLVEVSMLQHPPKLAYRLYSAPLNPPVPLTERALHRA